MIFRSNPKPSSFLATDKSSNMAQQALQHAQLSGVAANNGLGGPSSAVIGAGRANNLSAALAANQHIHYNHHHSASLSLSGSTLHQNHGSNFLNNQHYNINQQSQHLGHNDSNRSRYLTPGATSSAVSSIATAMALNSHFSHHSHPFSQQASDNHSTANSNSHLLHSGNNSNSHHHPLSLASSSHSSSSSVSSTTSSPPSASISPSSLAPGTPPQTSNSLLGLNPTSSYLASNNHHHNHHHYQSNMTSQQQQPHVVTNNSHLSSPQSSSSSVSSSSGSSTGSQQQQQQNTSRYKTELCRPFEENGTCKYGEKCQFAHGLGELRTLTRHPKYKTEFCRTFHTTGFCPYGPRCHFIHNSKSPPTSNATNQQQTISLGSFSNGNGGGSNAPFGHQTSHSASPSTSPISSTSSSTNITNGSASSSASTSSSSPGSGNNQRIIDSFSYGSLAGRLVNGPIDPSSNGLAVNHHQQHHTSAAPPPGVLTSAVLDSQRHHKRRNESEDVNSKQQGQAVATAAGCAKETQRLFWLHSQMNESSRWPPAMCASGLISGSNNSSRRTWQMQA